MKQAKVLCSKFHLKDEIFPYFRPIIVFLNVSLFTLWPRADSVYNKAFPDEHGKLGRLKGDYNPNIWNISCATDGWLWKGTYFKWKHFISLCR